MKGDNLRAELSLVTLTLHTCNDRFCSVTGSMHGDNILLNRTTSSQDVFLHITPGKIFTYLRKTGPHIPLIDKHSDSSYK